jgi:hypothetical protein
MQVTSIKRTLLFQELGNVTMTANVEPGDDVLEVQKYLEDLMVEGVQRYSRGEDTADGGICRACGCTDDHACKGGCFWVEDDLCSRCAALEISDNLQAELKRCCDLRDAGRISENNLQVIQDGADALVDGELYPMRDALLRLQLVCATYDNPGDGLVNVKDCVVVGHEAGQLGGISVTTSTARCSSTKCSSMEQTEEKAAGEKLKIVLRERLEDEIERCRKLIDKYNAIPTGAFAASRIRKGVSDAELAIEDGDVQGIELALEALRGAE